MPPQRRASDRKSVQVIGWIACLALAGSLTYTFVRALVVGPEQVGPLFFSMQTLGSLLLSRISIAEPTRKAKNIVLVHGLFADGSSWSEVIPRLQVAGLNVTCQQSWWDTHFQE